jgi:hypothetical protein
MTKLRRMRWAGHVARMGEKRNANRTLVEKTRRKEATRKTKMWVDNIKMDVREMGWDVVDWIDVAQVGTSGELL